MSRIFTGDFSGGNLLQWVQLANTVWTGNTVDYPGGYPVKVISEDKDCGYIARFEVRSGDVPAFGGGERSEMFCQSQVGVEGQTIWAAWSTKFDPSFPTSTTDTDWGTIAQFHDYPSGLSSPVISMAGGDGGMPWNDPNPASIGYFQLWQSPQPAPEDYSIVPVKMWEVPMDRGQWHDVKLQIKLSSDLTTDAGNPAHGFVRLWHNGVAQTLSGGSTTFIGQTMLPTTTGVKFQQGHYRSASTNTTVVYHTGTRIADSEASL